MKDPKSARRKYLMYKEIRNDCLRFKKECKYLGSHRETEQEKAERLKKKECKKRCEERFKLHI
ncbi:MAG: hypothetical protein K2F81_08950 [Ruminococcus sp.]|nr:hypothetical protein [Ruminococcus sp.]